MNRRDFIKAASGGALLLGAAPSVSHAGCRKPSADSWFAGHAV
ncbi:twin-arginine translocation signal domain-containing protein [Salmonella enterica]|nr:twin-arginine translocation signal domain-containing protein [Salmonella enterica]